MWAEGTAWHTCRTQRQNIVRVHSSPALPPPLMSSSGWCFNVLMEGYSPVPGLLLLGLTQGSTDGAALFMPLQGHW